MLSATGQDQLSRRRPWPMEEGGKEGESTHKHNYTDLGNNLVL